MLITIFIALSSALTVASAIPYVIEILHGKTKPRIASWFVWSVLTAIAGVASLVDKQYPAAILMLFATVETLLIVILGFIKQADKKLKPLDAVSLIGAGAGLVLWLTFDSPEVAVVAMVTIDFIGGLPTLVHSWKNPHEETWITFFLAFLGALFTVFAVSNWRITAVAYPIYIVLINVLYTVVLLGRRRYTVRGEPKELREL